MTTARGVSTDAVFLEHVARWYADLRPASLTEEVREPDKAAVFSVDMVVGFCNKGALASPRVGALVKPVVELFQRAYLHGVRHFVLLQDTHSEDAQEFKSFPPHCIRGTDESRTIPELRALSFAKEFVILEKDSLDPALGTGLDAWLEKHSELRELIVVGDCTDLCIYTLAMHLRLRANALGLKEQRVLVPANAVDTYDLPLDIALKIEAMPHPGDFLHRLFLYHMALNGIEVIRELG